MVDDDTRLARPLAALDRVTFGVERPVRRIAGSNRLNPLPHAGTISVFLLGVVLVSGLYITLFFQFGTEASYASVRAMEGHAIQKVVRAVHRYSSAALVLTTMVHAWRVFVGARFTGRPRRWRWATGVTALVLVWLAGVTGYWLVQDVRAQALSDAAAALLSGFDRGSGWAARHLSGVGAGSGAGLVLTAWFVHLGLTVVIGWFVFRHLRRSRLPWLPPRHWLILMTGALVLVSLAFPVGMLPAASPQLLPGDMPLDPFVLFLLPPLLSAWRWVALVGAVALLALVVAVPRLLRRADPAPIVVDPDACTGCELCVLDCPYQALTMSPALAGSSGSSGPERGLAVVDPAACVGCGICIGSCAFGALGFDPLDADPPGSDALPDVTGRAVVVACDRHLELSPPVPADDGEPVVLRVRCAGMFAPGAVADLMGRGATGVHLVGCPPHDCRYGVGNRLAAERLAGERAPHPARRWMASIEQDWVAPTELAGALAAPGAHPSLDDSRLPGRRDVVAGAAVLVALSVVAVAFATRAPFQGTDRSGIRVVVDHVAGRPLLDGGPDPVAVIDGVEVVVDGEVVARRDVPVDGEVSLGIIDVSLSPGGAEVTVTALVGDGRVAVYDDRAELAAGHRLVVSVADVPPPPGAVEGAELFTARASGCTVCHSVEAGRDGVGPSLYGVADRAGGRVAGLSAELYLRNSILLPDQYVVEGYRPGQMQSVYRDRFSEEELDALAAYLLTLTGDGGS